MRCLLNFITHEPELLAEAPDRPSLEAATARAVEEHLCLRCGRVAEGFFWIRPSPWSEVPRWMDLCTACCSLVYAVAES